MNIDLQGRDFLKEVDFTAAEFTYLLDLASELKLAKRNGSETRRLSGVNLALIFEKTSTRTRCAFEVAAFDQGAHVTFLDPQSSQLGHKESIADTAKVLSRFYDGIEFRGSAHETVEQLAAAADVPVFNGLTDRWHPTQMLADFLTMREHCPDKPLSALSYAYLGDARSNMGNSLLVTGALLGADVRIASPRELWPDAEVQQLAQSLAGASGARITLTDDPEQALPGADFVHTDVWVSLGEPASTWAERVALLRDYRVDTKMLDRTGNEAVRFMHCLPAFHDQNTTVGRDAAQATGLTDGIEVSSAVFDSSANIAFDQAENRLHTIKAVLVAMLPNRI
ncbi:MAG: ornithine carbamoyltransferase [Actinomycetes bacterium]